MDAEAQSRNLGNADKGTELIEELIALTGLPAESVRLEMTKLLSAAGINADSATLADLRDIFADYLQDALLEAKSTNSKI